MKTNTAFIDSQNLNLGVKSLGWEIDFRKLRQYLRNKYNVTQAFLFIGLVVNNQKLYTSLQQAGYVLIFKPTVKYYINGKETIKGNVDAELVLHAAAIEYKNYSKAVIVSGDGDFACLIDYLSKNDKLLKLLTPNERYSRLLEPYSKYIVKISALRTSLEYKKTRLSGRSKP